MQTISHDDTGRIADVLMHFSSTRAVWLFGSVARGRSGPESDVDVAVLPRGSSEKFPLLEAYAALVEAGLERVDLAVLGERDLVLRFEAVRHARLLRRAPDFDAGDYFSRTIREYFDFEPILRIQRAAMKRRYGAA